MTEQEFHERKFSYADMLEWRSIQRQEDVCPTCGGGGTRAYPSTALWSGGIGRSMISSGTCDTCWGSGDITLKGADLRIHMQLLEKRYEEDKKLLDGHNAQRLKADHD